MFDDGRLRLGLDLSAVGVRNASNIEAMTSMSHIDSDRIT